MIKLWLMTEKDRDALEAEQNDQFAKIQVLEERITVLEAAVLAIGGTLGQEEGI